MVRLERHVQYRNGMREMHTTNAIVVASVQTVTSTTDLRTRIPARPSHTRARAQRNHRRHGRDDKLSSPSLLFGVCSPPSSIGWSKFESIRTERILEVFGRLRAGKGPCFDPLYRRTYRYLSCSSFPLPGSQLAEGILRSRHHAEVHGGPYYTKLRANPSFPREEWTHWQWGGSGSRSTLSLALMMNLFFNLSTSLLFKQIVLE